MNKQITLEGMLDLIKTERKNMASLVQLGNHSLAGSLAINKPNCLYAAPGKHFDQTDFDKVLEDNLMLYTAALCGRSAIALLVEWESQGQPRSNLELIRQEFENYRVLLGDAEKYAEKFGPCFEFAEHALAAVLFYLDEQHRKAFYDAKTEHRAKYGRLEAVDRAKLCAEHINHGLFRLPHLVIRDDGKIETLSTVRLMGLLVLLTNICGNPILPHELEIIRAKILNSVSKDGLLPVEVNGIILSSGHHYLTFELPEDMAEKLKQRLKPLYSSVMINHICSNYNYLLSVPATA